MKTIDNVYLYSPAQVFQRDKIHHLKMEDGEICKVATGRYEGSSEDVIDGQQKVLTPSFTDSHLHLLRYGLMKTAPDLRMATSWAGGQADHRRRSGPRGIKTERLDHCPWADGQ